MESKENRLVLARWHLSQQEKRLQQQQDMIDRLACEGALKRERRARDTLMQMEKLAIRLRMEVRTLEAHELVRKKRQANGAHV